MTRHKVVLVGCGAIASETHVPAFGAESERSEIVAVVDADPDRARRFATEHDIASSYPSLESALRSEDIDLVDLCTPVSSHFDLACTALRAGSSVLVEKPAFRNLAEYDQVVGLERPGVYASVVLQQRFGTSAIRVQQQLRSGALGKPLAAQCVTAWYRDAEYYNAVWRGTWASEGGGTTVSLGVHQMDLLLALLGEWVEVVALAARLDRDVETDDISVCLVRFENGALATVMNSSLSPREESYIRIDTTEATLELTHLYGYSSGNWRITPGPTSLVSPIVVPLDERDDPSSHGALISSLLDSMDAGVRPNTSGREGRRALELTTAIYMASTLGKSVTPTDIGPGSPFYANPQHLILGWDRIGAPLVRDRA